MTRALAGAIAATFGWAAPAHAIDLTVAVGESDTLGGDLQRGQVTIAGTLMVKPYDGTEGSGWLLLRAREIVIESTGVIDGVRSGFPADATDPQGYDSGVGQSPSGAAPPSRPAAAPTPAPAGRA